jgi:shikimate kinase
MIETPQPAPDRAPTGSTAGSTARPRLNRTLVLVGLMGAGKTSVGKRLAGLLGVGFTDSDAEIVAAAGMSIPEIFATLGEPAFRDGERRVIARLLAERPGVLATGGGAFIEPRTRAEIKRHATSVWLRADLDLLWDRVRDRPGRPLLQAADPRAVLADLERRRSPIYAEADVVVDSRRGASHETLARAILAAIEAYDRAAIGRRPTLEPLP